MEYFEVFQTTFALFAVIAVGFFSRKKKIIGDQATVDFSRFVIRILFPIYLFQAASTYMTREYVLTAPIYFFLNVIVLICLFFISKLISKLVHVSPERESAFRICSMMGNTGFLGLTFAATFFGPEGVIAGTIYDFGGSIPFFMIIIPALFQKEQKSSIFTVFKEPNIIAVLIGMICGLLGLKIPGFLIPSFDMVSRITLPLALIMVGSQLAGIQTFSGHKYSQVFFVIMIKMIISPAILLGLIWFIPLSPPMKQFLVLEAAMPTAISMVNFSKMYNQDSDFASIGIFGTTLFSMIWLPLLMIGLTFIF